jgi:hypothetical protein
MIFLSLRHPLLRQKGALPERTEIESKSNPIEKESTE